MIKYTQHTQLTDDYIKSQINHFLAEDIPAGDVTTLGTVRANEKVTAYIEAQQDLVFAGEKIIPHFFGDDFSVEVLVNDGDLIPNTGIIAKITGPASEILTKERVILNLLQRLCGIATQTAEYADIARPHGIKILDTRKTTPGLRLFEKYAVVCGGGTNHRLDLSSGILIKDNHISAAGSAKQAVEQIKAMNPALPIELEVDNFEQIKIGLECNVDGFLLDNMDPVTTIEAVNLIRSSENGVNIFIESSGGITLETLAGYMKTGINAISIGALTHSVKCADMHMEFEK